MSKYKPMYVLLAVTTTVSIALELSIAWFLNIITDAAVQFNMDKWIDFIFVGAVILIVYGLNTYIDNYFKSKVSMNVRNDIRIDMMNHVLRLPHSFFSNSHSGDLLSRFTNDNQVIGDASGRIIVDLVKNPLLAVAAFSYLMYIEWRLALICISIGPLMMMIGKVFGSTVRKTSNNMQLKQGKVTSFLQDILGADHIFKMFNLEKKLMNQYIDHCADVIKIEKKLGKINAAANASSTVVGNLTFVIAILLAGYFVAKGSLNVGSMIAFIQLMNYLVMPFTVIPTLWANMQQALGGAERTFVILDHPVEYNDIQEQEISRKPFTSLKLSSVSFGYPLSDSKSTISDISFEIKEGQKIAIVGLSGGGKSTLFKLLLGLYPPDQGLIQINGRDIREIGIREQRNYFSYVPQENYLFSGTIKDNILDGNHSADEYELIAASQQANAFEFISKFPNGFASDIGEKGKSLSGGQKQRISIARAILRNSPVLLLDEATASLDQESEKIVQDALQKLMQGRTTIVISHRLSTTIDADCILVVEDGRIVEEGTHEQLMMRQSRYFALYSSQKEEEQERLYSVT
ncbi:ABC transporter ATP-binding protein [Paenibacillus monticola]|nr:ABC transporter ATP-binding protein [Paenibacillus monticola]